MVYCHDVHQRTLLTFCEEDSARTINVANACANSIPFHSCFNDTEDSEIHFKLLQCESMNLRLEISKLEVTLNPFHREWSQGDSMT